MDGPSASQVPSARDHAVEDGESFVSRVVWNEEVVMVEASDDVATQPLFSQCLADRGCESDGVEGGVHAKSDPCGDEVIGEAGVVRLLLLEHHRQSLRLHHARQRVEVGEGICVLDAHEHEPPLNELRRHGGQERGQLGPRHAVGWRETQSASSTRGPV